MTVSAKAKLAGVVGWPVGHSLSPTLHAFWIAEHKIDAMYVPLAIRPEDFSEAFAMLPKLGFRGVNVTLPHKETAFRLTTDHDAAALATGAVNTVVFDDNKAIGKNTDLFGFSAMLLDADVLLASKRAVVLGAGGAARAVVGSLQSLGVAGVSVVNRTVEKAESLVKFFRGSLGARSWDALPSLLPQTDVLVNTTKLGMQGEPPLTIDLSAMRRDAVVVDVVYRPLETPLLAQARARGLKTVDGLGMLLHQARPAFAAWFGVEPQVTPQLRAHLIAQLERG
jgi:shikimate dehydrogenase